MINTAEFPSLPCGDPAGTALALTRFPASEKLHTILAVVAAVTGRPRGHGQDRGTEQDTAPPPTSLSQSQEEVMTRLKQGLNHKLSKHKLRRNKGVQVSFTIRADHGLYFSIGLIFSARWLFYYYAFVGLNNIAKIIITIFFLVIINSITSDLFKTQKL